MYNFSRHIPHVMTLFDRKVDLARFNDSTPLYVMCREWMCNNPEKLGTAILTNGTTHNTMVRSLWFQPSITAQSMKIQRSFSYLKAVVEDWGWIVIVALFQASFCARSKAL